MSIQTREPQTSEMEAYFRLRHKVLRQPWNQPPGTERDDMEDQCFHLAAFTDENEIIACGRLQLNTPDEAQVRFMAVDPSWHGKGVGKLVMQGMEAEAINRGAKSMILHARENAIPFYLSCGYTVSEKSYLLFGSIQHFLMEKLLR